MMDILFDGLREDRRYYYAGRKIKELVVIRTIGQMEGMPGVVSRITSKMEDEIPVNCAAYELRLEGRVVTYIACDFAPGDRPISEDDESEGVGERED